MIRIRVVSSSRAAAMRKGVVCCAMALSGLASAQTLESPVPASDATYVAGGQIAVGGDAAPRVSARGVFVTTIAALIAQSLGSGIGDALSQGLSGSIINWFARPVPAGAPAAPSPASPSTNGQEQEARPHAGLAYEIHLLGRDGASKAVDPAQHVFRTNERFQVYYRPALPGRVKVLNVNPGGSESRLDTVEVAAGQLATLGPYQFVGAKGDETLRLILEPCASRSLTLATRTIVKASNASAEQRTLPISECSESRTPRVQATARTIKKVAVDGSTSFALEPLSNSEVRSGQVRAREIRIVLRHK